MRSQASFSASVEVAYEMRNDGELSNAAPCTQATPSSSSKAVTKSSSFSIFLPPELV